HSPLPLSCSYRLYTASACSVHTKHHEPHSPLPGHNAQMHKLDRRHSEFLAGADLVIHDAQYTDKEYANHRGWGHSPMEYVSEIGQLAGVKQMAFSHHDPGRTDDALDQIVESIRSDLKEKGSLMHVF